MTRFTKAALALLVFSAMSASGTSARPGLIVNTRLTYTDNLFRNYSKRSDWISLTYFELYQRMSGSTGIYYSGNANVFAEYEDLFMHQHEIGTTYHTSQGGRNAFYAGLLGRARLDRPVYRYYDAIEGEGYARWKRYLRPSLLGRAGLRARWRHYYHAADYSYIESLAHGQVSRFLPTRTTLEIRLSGGLKSYVRADQREVDGVVIRSRSGGSRHLAQMTAAAKVAQSVATGLGLQVEYSLRANLSGRNRYAELEGYNTDEELFDDRYSYDQSGLSVALKKVWRGGSYVRVEGAREARSYLGRPALDLDGFAIGLDQTRDDTRWRGVLSAGYSWVGFGPIRKLQVETLVLYRNVDSNDPYYDAASRLYSIGLSATL